MTPLTIEFDTKPFEAAIQRYAAQTLPSGVTRGLARWGEDTMGEAKGNFVPVMDGTLRNSGVVLPVARSGEVYTLTLGFGGPAAPYAAKTHENPRAGKTGGVSPTGRKYKRWAKVGGYKFLEAPMAQRGPRLPESIAAEVR